LGQVNPKRQTANHKETSNRSLGCEDRANIEYLLFKFVWRLDAGFWNFLAKEAVVIGSLGGSRFCVRVLGQAGRKAAELP
jgi:hypothetical protein